MSDCHNIHEKFKLKRKNVILVGNPNAGKSVIFHKLTGTYATVSNYPGTTLQIIQGKFKEYSIVDTPGVYGLSSENLEEKTTKDIVLKAHKIISVVNALHLERDLFLTLQLIDMGLPVLVVLNFMDESERVGYKIDVKKLSQKLGVKVVPTVAVKGEGIPKVQSSLSMIKPSSVKHSYTWDGPQTFHKIKNKAKHVLAMEGDKDILKEFKLNINMSPLKIFKQRRERVDDIVKSVRKKESQKVDIKKNISDLMTHPIYGFMLIAFILYLAYQIVGVFVAQTIVGFTEGKIMLGYYMPFIQELFAGFQLPLWLTFMLVGEFGILTMPVNYLLGLLLPLVFSFYLFLALLEDSGYLPRLAFLVDELLNKLGLNGKAIIPLILGFGCVTMATITTRILNTERERTIASALLNFAIPCSAQLAVITALVATAGGLYTFAFFCIIFAFFVFLGTILHNYLPGKSTSLILSLPSLQIPQIKNVLLKTIERTKHFLYEAGVWFFVGALLLSILQLTGILEFLQNLISPIVVHWMGLPKEAANSYIMGIVRRDFGAAGFFSLALNQLQLLVALVSITLFVPCIAAILILYKERKAKIATIIWIGTIVTAFIVGGLINKLGVFLGGL